MLVQGIECPSCSEKIWSRHRHDMRYCKCGYCYVDGGRDYLRTGWGLNPGKLNEEMTPEDWSSLAEANARIGRPLNIEIEVPDPAPVSAERRKEIEKMSLMKFMLALEKQDELSKSGNRKQASGIRPKSSRSKPDPGKPVRRGKDKAPLRK